MPPEAPSFEQQELNPEQKRQLGEAWAEMVVNDIDVPENIGEMSSVEIKKWLFESIMQDTARFAHELGLKVDTDLVAKIQNAESPEEKAAMELEYIKNVHAQVDSIVQKFERSGEKSTKWDSWPKRMRETGEFNCVGASLLGTYLLEKGGIESYSGNPHEHAVNIAKLSNGEWWYVDFRNGARNVLKLEPEEIKVANVPTLKIKQFGIDYRLIPLHDKSEIAGSVLGNFSSLQREAQEEDMGNIEQKEARAYLERYGRNFQKVDFSLLPQILYPEKISVSKSDAMQAEVARIKKMRDFERPVHKYMMALPKDREKAVLDEMKIKMEAIEKLFYQNDTMILMEVGPELKKVLELFVESLRSVKDKEPEVYQEAVDRIIGRMKSL